MKVDEQRKECKDALVEHKKTIKTLKKKLRYYRDRLKQHCGNNESEHRAMSPESHVKRTPKNSAVSQENKQRVKNMFINAKEEESKRSHRKVDIIQTSDNIRKSSKGATSRIRKSA